MPHESPKGRESNEIEKVAAALREREEYDAVSEGIVNDWVEMRKGDVDRDPTGRSRIEFDIDQADLYLRAGYPAKAINIFYDLAEIATTSSDPALSNRIVALGLKILGGLQKVAPKEATGEDAVRHAEMVAYVSKLNQFILGNISYA